MTRVVCVGSIAAIAACVVVLPASAQSRRPMRLVDLLNVPRLADPQLSPDARHVLFVREDADWSADRRIGHIYRINADGSGLTQMTQGDGETGPRWSPDGRTIAFLARRNGDVRQIYLLPAGGGEAKQLTAHPTTVSDISWTPDGRWIYFTARDDESPEEKSRKKAKDDVYAFDESYEHEHLWRVAVDGTETRLTEGTFSILSYELSRDGTKIVYHRAPSPLVGDADRGEVWVADADGRNALQLTHNTVSETNAALSPDNQQVLFTSNSNERFTFYYNANLFIVPAAGGDARMLTGDSPYEVGNASWAKDGQSVFLVANMGVHSELVELDVATRRTKNLTNGEHAVNGWTYVPGVNRHVLQLDEPTRPGEVWVLDATNGAVPTKVTVVHDDLARAFRLPRQERVQWKGADGTLVEGLIFYPVDYQPGHRYPLCVQTHGGPASSDKFGFQDWRSYVPVLAGMGYLVFKPNYRGSTGYGDEFLRDMVGGYFNQAHLDVMSGVDHLIARGLVDPNRMVKMGWSAGGHMTNKIVTFTDRFKAASSGAGAANWVSMYAQSDTRIYRTPWFGGTPWQVDAPIDRYWDHSPLKDASKVTTPTIFLVGEDDERVPMPQSVEMYRALKSHGVPTHLYVAPREGHGWTELRHQLFKMNVELEWFERHAMGRPYAWEQPPESRQ